jgi:hypothetical protein
VQNRDPRWLVEPRQDGTNVNGWHWQDKNRFAWAKERLEQAVPELPPAQTGNARITKVTDVVGEVREKAGKPSGCCDGIHHSQVELSLPGISSTAPISYRHPFVQQQWHVRLYCIR